MFNKYLKVPLYLFLLVASIVILSYLISLISIYLASFLPLNTDAGILLDLSGNSLLIAVTVIYVLATYEIVDGTKQSIKQNEKQLEQTKNEQRIVFVERKLEKLYLPLKTALQRFDIDFLIDTIDKMEEYQKKGNNGDASQCFKNIIERLWYFKNDFDKVSPHLYMASDDLDKDLNEFLDLFESNKLFVEKWENLDDYHRYEKAVSIMHKEIVRELGVNVDLIFDRYVSTLGTINKDIVSLKEELAQLIH